MVICIHISINIYVFGIQKSYSWASPAFYDSLVRYNIIDDNNKTRPFMANKTFKVHYPPMDNNEYIL